MFVMQVELDSVLCCALAVMRVYIPEEALAKECVACIRGHGLLTSAA